MIIRNATSADSTGIAALITELGYLSDVAAVPGRLHGLTSERSTAAVVAEVDGRIVGLATAHAFYAIHVDHPTAYLTALIVSASQRQQGVGRVLVHHMESWARGQGAVRLSLVTGVPRTDSHPFYERLGYTRTGYRYSKQLL